MTEGLVRSLGIGRFLDWGTLDAHGSAGGLLICLDKGPWRPFSREDRECMWEEIGLLMELELIDLPLQGGVLPGVGGEIIRTGPELDRQGPSPFRFENMWLKANGFKDLLRGWWQGSEGWKLIKLNSQQVEFWDGVESERSLSEGETEMKKEAKESFKKWVLMEEIHGGHGIFGVKDAYNLLVVPNAWPSRLNAFGWIRSQPKLLFLLEKPRGGRFSL
ncbi:hypothetical protein CK203_113763 [Vitis vinifera]|uniref:DUF4283 domain-containing protein n=1 Tax=Vitis vinifera TaxID=29760 RepID=A0A438CPG8_VITVI|nr:hypothetical protein CK203_113763 [Vitis vinifera]